MEISNETTGFKMVIDAKKVFGYHACEIVNICKCGANFACIYCGYGGGTSPCDCSRQPEGLTLIGRTKEPKSDDIDRPTPKR